MKRRQLTIPSLAIAIIIALVAGTTHALGLTSTLLMLAGFFCPAVLCQRLKHRGIERERMIAMMRPNDVRARERGQAALETALLAPWLVFLLIGALDLGFYGHALIATQNAVRVAVLHTSASTAAASDQAGACRLVLRELGSLPNIAGLGTSFNCQSTPLVVTASLIPTTSSPDGAAASQVTITYQADAMIPIPGLLTGRLAFTRTALSRVRS